MKFAVMPMMVMRQTHCMVLTTFQVAASAPPEVRADILDCGVLGTESCFCWEREVEGLEGLKVLSK